MEIVRINDASQHGLIISDLSLSISKSIDSPSFNQLINLGAKEEKIEALLAVLILKYSNMLSVSGNLKQGQALEFAQMIISDWPTMSLDDFNILLSNGVKGRYNEPGKLFRFDISVIYGWIEAYQIQFAEVKEKQVRQPSALEMLSTESLSKLAEIVKDAPGLKSLPGMSKQEIRKFGKESPEPINTNQYITSKDYAIELELKRIYARECTHPHSGEILKGMPTFEEWLKQ